MRIEHSGPATETPIPIPVTIIHHAGEAGPRCIPSSTYSTPSHIPDPSTPAIPFHKRFWTKTKYGRGYIKIHTGTTTYWQMKSRDRVALSEGTKLHNGGCRTNIFHGGNAYHRSRNPHHPFFFCWRCKQNCYYEVHCFFGYVAIATKVILRMVGRSV